MGENKNRFDQFMNHTLQNMIEEELENPMTTENSSIKQLILLYLFVLNNKEKNTKHTSEHAKRDATLSKEDLQLLLQRINGLRRKNKTFLAEIYKNDLNE